MTPTHRSLNSCSATSHSRNVEVRDSARQCDESQGVGVPYARGELMGHCQESLRSMPAGATSQGNERRLGGQSPSQPIRLAGAEREQQVEGLEVRGTNRIDPGEADGHPPHGIDASREARIEPVGRTLAESEAPQPHPRPAGEQS